MTWVIQYNRLDVAHFNSCTFNLILLWHKTFLLQGFVVNLCGNHIETLKTADTSCFIDKHQFRSPDCQQLNNANKRSDILICHLCSILLFCRFPVDRTEPVNLCSLLSLIYFFLFSHPEPGGGRGSPALLLLLLPQSEADTAAAKPRRSHHWPGRRWVNFDPFGPVTFLFPGAQLNGHMCHMPNRRADRCHKSAQPLWSLCLFTVSFDATPLLLCTSERAALRPCFVLCRWCVQQQRPFSTSSFISL